MSEPATNMVNGFQKLSLSPALLASIERAGFKKPTSIQAAFIPRVLSGVDVMGQAQTGTGKTAAYTIPFLQLCQESNQQDPTGLVLVPTRELAVQVVEEVQKLAGDKFRVMPIYGGKVMQTQISGL